MLSLVMDAIVAVLLIATIAFAIRLNQRLGTLNKEREGMERLVSGLHTASRQAEEAVAGLKAAALENGQRLHEVVEKAEGLKLDLEFMMDKGNGLADRLEAGLRGDRKVSASGAASAPVVVPVLSEIRPGREASAASDRPSSSRLAAILRRSDNAEEQSKPARMRSHATTKHQPAEDEDSIKKAAPDAASPAIPESRAERDLKRALEARR